MRTIVTKTPLKDLLLIHVDYFQDERGFLIESWHKKDFEKEGINLSFVLEIHSQSKPGVIRGLHYQDQTAPMAKVIRCIVGSTYVVAVDIRSTSETFGKWFSTNLTEENKKQIYIPVGFAVGFAVLGNKNAELLYKVTNFYTPSAEKVLLWNDKKLAIDWPFNDPIVSERDKKGTLFTAYEKNPSFI